MELEINFTPQPPNPERTIESFYHLAKAAIEDIRTFQPDLVMVLAHGGWGVQWAVEALWEKGEPFPPVLVTNIGREKRKRYEDLRPPEFYEHMGHYVADYAGDIENGFFLAWVSRQKGWQDALRNQVLETLQGSEPKRVLVLDDGDFEGGTFRLVLRLVADAFPGCAAHMLAGDAFEWRNEIADKWLVDRKIRRKSRRFRKLDLQVFDLVAGTEDDGDVDSLNWRAVTPGNKVFDVLAKYLPVETWMELPAWAEREIKERVAGFSRKSSTDDEWVQGRPVWFSLDKDELVLQHVWLHGSISLGQAAEILETSAGKAGNRLRSLAKYGILQRDEKGRQVSYTLPDEYVKLRVLLP
jgi:hypothetical protein